MENRLVLSCFSGIGMLDETFRELGWCVVSAGDVMWGSLYDLRRFRPPAGVFDGVIAGVPCKPFSRLAHMVRANGYTVAPNLIPELERVIAEAKPRWWLMENVPVAPSPVAPGYRSCDLLFNNRWSPEAPEQDRLRKFVFGWRQELGWPVLVPETCILQNGAYEPTVTSHAEPTPVKWQRNSDGSYSVKTTAARARRTVERCCELQGLPPDFLKCAPFTQAGKYEVIGNGAPLPLGRAIARAVTRALEAGPCR